MSNSWRQTKCYIKLWIKKLIIFILRRYLPSSLERLRAAEEGAVDRDERFASLLLYCLTNVSNPVVALNHCSETIRVSNRFLLQVLNDLQNLRAPAFEQLLTDAEAVCSVEVRMQLLIKRVLLNPTSKEDGLQELWKEYRDNQHVLVGSRAIKGLLVTAILEKSLSKNIELWFEKFQLSLDLLGDSQRLRFLLRLVQSQDRKYFKHWDLVFSKELSPSNGVKVCMMRFWLDRDVDGFSKLERMFCNQDTWLSRRYEKSIKPLLDKISAENNFLNARFDINRLEYLRCLIADKVANQVGFAYIRLGDGECYGFDESDDIDYSGILRQELHWWGTELDEELRRELQSKFCDALPYADMLGVPTVLRLIRDFNPSKQDEYPKNSLMARLFSVMEGAAPFMESRIIVEDQSNLYLFDAEFIERLVRLAKKVYVVSGVSAALVDAWNPDSSKIEHIEIPTHRLLKVGNVGSEVSGIFPLVYQEYIDRVSQLAGPGIVFLFSAGFIGKILIAEVARKGSVGLDVGQYLLSAVTE